MRFHAADSRSNIPQKSRHFSRQIGFIMIVEDNYMF